MSHHIALLFLLLVTAAGRQSVVPLAQSPTSACPVADDDQYAYTADHPVQVGGSPAYGAARERRYLESLRGPAGQQVRYERHGSTAPRGAMNTILDVYELTYDGLAKPVQIYVDWYHFNPQRAPRGFICGQPIGLGIPPVAPFQEMEDLQVVALTQGAARDFPPIPLDADGATTHGVVFDRFRMLARAARAAAAAGTPVEPTRVRIKLPVEGMVVLAYPLTCDDRLVRPAAIDMVAPNGAVMPRSGQSEIGEANLARVLPGIQAPAGSLGVAFQLSRPRPDDSIRISYAGAVCGGTTNEVALPVKFTGARGIEMPAPRLPEGAPADQPVLLQALVDTDGSIQRATYLGGPPQLTSAAIDAVGRWRSEPARVNGAPVPVGVLLQIRFAAAVAKF